jgi:hypothetical protein
LADEAQNFFGCHKVSFSASQVLTIEKKLGLDAYGVLDTVAVHLPFDLSNPGGSKLRK